MKKLPIRALILVKYLGPSMRWLKKTEISSTRDLHGVFGHSCLVEFDKDITHKKVRKRIPEKLRPKCTLSESGIKLTNR